VFFMYARRNSVLLSAEISALRIDTLTLRKLFNIEHTRSSASVIANKSCVRFLLLSFTPSDGCISDAD
jgi:hypothetical protein